MAFTKHGDDTYEFSFDSVEATAIATATGIKPQELEIQGEPEFVAEAQDEEGATACVAVSNETKRTFTLRGYLVNPETFNGASLTFTFDGKFYIVTGRNKTVANRDFVKAELTGISYDLITAPTP